MVFLTTVFPTEITPEWIINLLVAFVLGIVSGKLIKTILWVGLLLIAAYIIIQLFFITPTFNLEEFFSPEQIREVGQNAWEWIINVGSNLKEHLIANATMIISFILGFIVSLFI